MHYELISSEEYDSLPEGQDQKFVELEAICRRNMNKMINDQTSPGFDSMVRMQYMTTVSSAAQELGIEGVLYPHHSDNPANEVDNFLLQASGVVTRIRLRSSRKNQPMSVQLGIRTKAKIELQIQKLREIVNGADISDIKRKALLEKLDEFSIELNRVRLSFGKVTALLASISVGLCVTVAGTTSFLADAPQAIATINNLIGQDKELEEEESKRLGAPVERKALPAPPLQSVNVPQNYDFDLDDEIPF